MTTAETYLLLLAAVLFLALVFVGALWRIDARDADRLAAKNTELKREAARLAADNSYMRDRVAHLRSQLDAATHALLTDLDDLTPGDFR